MKILILGYKGMLGYELVEAFFEGNELFLWDREQIDITKRDDVIKKIGKLKPDIVINSAAYTAVDKAESEKDAVYKVNGCAVGFLSTICKEIDALLIHFSTDYVFDGENHLGYKEDHLVTKPITLYGRSKVLGEKLITDINPRHYLIRTSWLFGKNGKNFVETMIGLANEKRDIKVVNDQFGSPTYAKDLAYKVREMVNENKPSGIYHITNSNHCSWYEFALKIFELAGLSPNVKPVKTEEFPTPAKRPTYSMLVNTKLSSMRSWEDALEEYLIERKNKALNI
ncbi:MAG: dTDP-4-dehydrorhamnose reductase [Candidatus Pacebacteria bacterium]|nr:dTDP-4-dehydrorhamnose reductase [Candidatus Paceibacterota bacterium]